MATTPLATLPQTQTIGIVTQTAAASAQAGGGLSINADPAVAGTVNAGAAAGGSVTVTAGNAARLTSGNANGGNISLVPGTGIGTGIAGTVVIGGGGISSSGNLNVSAGSGLLFCGTNNASGFNFRNLGLANNAGVQFTNTANNFFSATVDLGLNRNAAGVLELNNGTQGTPAAAPGITIPNSGSGAGSNFTITGSSAFSGSGDNGGDIILTPGVKDGAGVNGNTQIGRVVAVGSGAGTFLLSTGGAPATGPQTLTQNEWMQLKDSAGNIVWVPVWR